MTTLEAQITELKAGRTLAQLKAEDKKLYFKVQGLSKKLSEQKAKDSGNFITREHLSEYRNLIIWAMNRCNYQGHLNLKEAMTEMLQEVERGTTMYRTTRGIKGILVNMATAIALDNAENNLREANGLTILTPQQHPVISRFIDFKLQTLMQ